MRQPILSDAWVLYKGDGDGKPGELVYEKFEVNPISEHEVLVEPLYGCWEGNMSHAIERKPVDIALQRGEEKVVIGNAGVVQILEKGLKVNTCEVGDICIVFCVGTIDRWGYPVKIMAYDAPGTMGVLSKISKMPGHSVIPIPKNTKFSLAQWAGFSLRYVTAWANWKVAYRCWRAQLEDANPADEYVVAWGGGVSYAEGLLAQKEGFNVIMISSGEDRLSKIETDGMHAIDRREFSNLHFDPSQYHTDKNYKKLYTEAENKFITLVHQKTGGRDAAIVIDYIGLAVYRASLKILDRMGVITTAGWKEGMVLTNYRAIECISRHIHVHTHYANYKEGVEAVSYAEANGWLPEINEGDIYPFRDIPKMQQHYDQSLIRSYFPIFRISER